MVRWDTFRTLVLNLDRSNLLAHVNRKVDEYVVLLKDVAVELVREKVAVAVDTAPAASINHLQLHWYIFMKTHLRLKMILNTRQTM